MKPEWRRFESKAKLHFAQRGELAATKQWLERNPPPDDWQAGPWAWAYTERSRPLFSILLARLLGR